MMPIRTLFTSLFFLFLLSACVTQTEGPYRANTLGTQAKNPPRHIALLLPLTGAKANQARVIQNGFFAAYYDYKKSAKTDIQVSVLNTSQQALQTIYQKALAEGADFIVGPLLKEEVAQLDTFSELKVPFIALNTLSVRTKQNQFFQFALSPQDESVQAAEKAYNSGYRNAMVISLAGSWGDGIATAFSERWRTLGGKVVANLALGPKEKVGQHISKLLGLKPELSSANGEEELIMQGSKRTDFDVIFLALPTNVARQVVPLLKYYGVDHVAIFATSLVNTSLVDNDLNGVIFCDIPAVLGVNQAKSSRLFAFGKDAFELTQHLSALSSGGQYSGATGDLYLSTNGEIKRKLPWAQIQDGEPVLLK